MQIIDDAIPEDKKRANVERFGNWMGFAHLPLGKNTDTIETSHMLKETKKEEYAKA